MSGVKRPGKTSSPLRARVDAGQLWNRAPRQAPAVRRSRALLFIARFANREANSKPGVRQYELAELFPSDHDVVDHNRRKPFSVVVDLRSHHVAEDVQLASAVADDVLPRQSITNPAPHLAPWRSSVEPNRHDEPEAAQLAVADLDRIEEPPLRVDAKMKGPRIARER
jgi:hypothetical protein